MNASEHLHNDAMRYAQEAYVAENSGEGRRAQGLYQRAFDAEREAAFSYIAKENEEPTRSVLLRSAAELALRCGEAREAERLAAQALLADPPTEIARELREVMAEAYSVQEGSLCGRHAEDLAALSLVYDLDNAAVAAVWLGKLLIRWESQTELQTKLATNLQELCDLRTYFRDRFAATWAGQAAHVQSFADFSRSVSQVEDALDAGMRDLAAAGESSDTSRLNSAHQPVADRVREALGPLRQTTHFAHREMFPGDWGCDEPTQTSVDWVVSVPEGRRLLRLCHTVRWLAVPQRRQVRTALINCGMEPAKTHTFDTYTDMFIWESVPSSILPAFDPLHQGFSEEFAEKITLAELHYAADAVSRDQARKQFLAAATRAAIVQYDPSHSDDVFCVAAAYAEFLALTLADDDLTERVIWRSCSRMLREAGYALESTEYATRRLYNTARSASTTDIALCLRNEVSLARPSSVELQPEAKHENSRPMNRE